MAYRLAVNPSVLETIDTLPSTTRTRVLQSFCTIMGRGLLALNHKKLSWHSESEFKLTISRKSFDMKLRNGVIADGFLRDDKRGCIFIEKLHPVNKDTRISNFAHDYKKPITSKKNTVNYVELGNDWVAEEIKNPFIHRNNSEGFSSLFKTPVTHSMIMESRFYGDIDQIHLSKAIEKRHGFKPYITEESAQDYCEHMRFDASSKNDILKKSLYEFLENYENYPETLVIVNFIDELDPLSLAQSEFINFMIFYMHCQFPDLKIQVVDVITRDLQGAQPYIEEFTHYHKQHRLALDGQNKPLAPFTMVLGELPCPLRGRQLRLPLPGYRRWFDIDLFANCREQADYSYMRTAIYKGNLRSAAYDLMRAGGLMNTKIAMVNFKDLRDYPKSEVHEDIIEILKFSAVLLMNDDKNSPAYEVAKTTSDYAQAIGFPFIVTIQTNFVEPGMIAVPVNMDGSKLRICKITKNDDDAHSSVLDGVIEAHERNPYLATLDCRTFLFDA